MTNRRLLAWPIFATILLTISAVHAQDQGVMSEEAIQQMMEMVKSTGMDPEQLKQVESMMQGVAGDVTVVEAAQKAEEQREFDVKTAGLGKFIILINEASYELQITKCDTRNQADDDFSIQAESSPGTRNGQLVLYKDDRYKRVVLQYFGPPGEFDVHIRENIPQLVNGVLDWTGEVDGPKGRTKMTLRANCRLP